MKVTITRARSLSGEVTVPPDKSISHRAAMIGGIAEGTTRIRNFSLAGDPQTTLKGMEALGTDIDHRKGEILLHGQGLRGLKAPASQLDAGNSGTMIRLLSGILVGQSFESTVGGDDSLNHRPMRRIIEPLRDMGADISGVEDQYPPLHIKGGTLHPITYRLPVASAQVKSCILLASLYADGRTTVIESAKTRDHTERMLGAAGVTIERRRLKDGSGYEITLEGKASLRGLDTEIPGDLSAAAFFIVAATIVPRSEILVRDVGLNPTRRGMIDILKRMEGKIAVEDERQSGGDPMGHLLVKSAHLRATRIAGEIIPNIIDEIPILAIAATQARGETIIRDAAELRVKETDRIAAVVQNLRRMGARVGEMPDGIIVEGGHQLHGAEIDSFGDHRIAMAFAVAGLVADGETIINGAEWADISFPGFFETLSKLRQQRG
jgi:3-phosphoshikimate 1-carboxyvinyltransferase